MSQRYPDKMACPDCGLTVAGNATTGKLRAHSRAATLAGKTSAACARPRGKRGEELEAAEHRRAAAARRAEWYQSRDRAPSITASGTAQPVRHPPTGV